jgi:hypothetical protein
MTYRGECFQSQVIFVRRVVFLAPVLCRFGGQLLVGGVNHLVSFAQLS